MYWLTYPFVWLRRIGHCRGFGIQSPTDYRFVRYVINEHWPYYAYASLEESDEALTRKLGRLYFRIANWRQPSVIVSNGYHAYLQAGCQRAEIREKSSPVELQRIVLTEENEKSIRTLFDQVDDRSIIIAEGLRQNKRLWRFVSSHPKTRVTFDLYYCGIVMFDHSQSRNHYIINF